MGECLGKDDLTLGRTGKESEEEGLFTPVILVVQKGEKEEGRGEEELEKSLFFSRQRKWNARKRSSGPEEE